MSSAPRATYKVSHEVREYLPIFRQKYRALLREATYLPDSAARAFVHDQIVNRYNPPNPQKLNWRFWGTDFFRAKVDLKKLQSRSKKTAQKLHLLERVNLEGSSKDLQHVLLRTYGRAGVRRSELLSQLLRPGEEEVPQDDTALSQIIDSQIAKKLDATKDVDVDKARDVSKRQRREHKEITLFIASQQAINPMESVRGRIKSIKPEIPITNAWGRKIPVKRKANMLRAWWANLLERVLPPLPEHEWNRLRDLAEGIEPIEYAPPRRKPAILRNLDPSDKSTGEEMNSLYNEPARLHANFWTKSAEKARSGTVEISDDAKHNSTRARRRMYRMIWSLSAKMVQDENTKEYTITWGGQRSPAAAGEITKPSFKDNEFFEMPNDVSVQATTDRKAKKSVEREAKQLAR